MSDMYINTSDYPHIDTSHSSLPPPLMRRPDNGEREQPVILHVCRCYFSVDQTDSMDTGTEGKTQSKLVKFHEQSCEHQKRISKLRDEWYEKELLYSPTVCYLVASQ